jgi:hypothetical protein
VLIGEKKKVRRSLQRLRAYSPIPGRMIVGRGGERSSGAKRSRLQGKLSAFDSGRSSVMAFEAADKQRFLELLKEEWQKGTGAVDVPVIVDRLRNEGMGAPDTEVGSFIMLIEEEGAAEVLAANDAEKSKGNAVIRNIALE